MLTAGTRVVSTTHDSRYPQGSIGTVVSSDDLIAMVRWDPGWVTDLRLQGQNLADAYVRHLEVIAAGPSRLDLKRKIEEGLAAINEMYRLYPDEFRGIYEELKTAFSG